MAFLLYLILLLLPINLGKHFVFDFSYSEGVLVDYALPTLYLQDILILLFVILQVVLIRKFPRRILNTLPIVALLLINCLYSVNIYASMYFVLRFFLYLVFAIMSISYVKKIKNHHLFLVGLLSVCLLSVLALAQWSLQSSVFNNYLVLGEQPYSILTPGILRHSFLGNTIIPPYSLFKHPNILGGYLSLVLVWMCMFLVFTREKISHTVIYLLFFVLLISICALFLTFSISAWLSFTLGLVGIYLYKYNKRLANKVMLFSVAGIFILGMFGFFSDILINPTSSLTRRFVLIQSAVYSFGQSPLFGSGINTFSFTTLTTPYFVRDISFYQPVHNVFWLILSEGGLFLFIPTAFFLSYAYIKNLKNTSLFSITFSQFFLLSVFDHYLITSSQMLLLVLLTIVTSVTYTFKHEI